MDTSTIHFPLHHFLTSHASDNIFSDSTLDFDKACKTLKHSHCKICHCTSLNLIVSNNICTICRQNHQTEEEYRDSLPIWYEDPDNNKHPHFDLPEELSCLRGEEKLLLQHISCYIPLHHLANGQVGLKGHVCCFEQAIGEVCSVLPRLPCNIKII
jgi:hypothetical protein